MSETSENFKKMATSLEGVTHQLEVLLRNTITQTNATYLFNEQNKTMISGLEKLQNAKSKVTKEVKKEVKENSELVEIMKDFTSESQRFKDSMMEVRREIMEVTHVTKGMDKSMFQAMSQSKLWTAGSRLLSGTGLWSVQNAIRGVIDVVSIYQTAQEKKTEVNQKAAKAMENYTDTENKYRLEAEKLNAVIKEAQETGDYRDLTQQSLSFKLMVARGIQEEHALKLLNLEVDAMDELLEKQKKLIFGGKIRKAIRGKLAEIEIKVIPALKKFFRGDEGKDDDAQARGKGGLFGQRRIEAREDIMWTKEDKEVKEGTETADTIRQKGTPEQKSGMELFKNKWRKDNMMWKKADKGKRSMTASGAAEGWTENLSNKRNG